jgi:ribosome maturation factor RimP
MITIQQIREFVSGYLKETDLFEVEISVSAGNSITVLIDSMRGVNINDCVHLTRAIESAFDREVEDYELEVSSPGLSLPFKVWQQYIKNIGRTVEIVFKNGLKTTGKMVSAEDHVISLEVQKKMTPEGKKRPELVTELINISLQEVKSTKVVINF